MHKIYHVGALPLLLSACAQTTPLPVVSTELAATDPSVASSFSYRDPMAGYTYRGPADIRDWRDVNREQGEGK